MGTLTTFDYQVGLRHFFAKTKRPLKYTSGMPEDDHKVEPPAGHIGFVTSAGKARHSTVTALREYMVAVEPNLKFDIDKFVGQTKGQSDHVLRVIVSDLGVSCGDLKIDTGYSRQIRSWHSLRDFSKTGKGKRKRASVERR